MSRLAGCASRRARGPRPWACRLGASDTSCCTTAAARLTRSPGPACRYWYLASRPLDLGSLAAGAVATLPPLAAGGGDGGGGEGVNHTCSRQLAHMTRRFEAVERELQRIRHRRLPGHDH